MKGALEITTVPLNVPVQVFFFIYDVLIMVFILDGNSEHVAHA